MDIEQLIGDCSKDLEQTRGKIAMVRGRLGQLEAQLVEMQQTEQQLLGALAVLNQLRKPAEA